MNNPVPSGVNRNETNEFLRPAIRRVIQHCARLVQRHPFIWKFSWEAVHWLPFLLPHDKSYRALRHFIALKPEGLFLDVGANDGISALSFRRFSRDYRILSLEPNALLEPALKKLKNSDPYFDYAIIGAGSSSERMKFFVPVYKNIILHTFTSADHDHVLKAITKSFGASVVSEVEIKAIDCDIVAIDSLNLNPTIIKIDAEGLDYAVLQGLVATLDRTRPLIVVEIGSDEEHDRVKMFFRERHYEFLTYDFIADKFHHAPTWDIAVKEKLGHHNFFAVPGELLTLIPIKQVSRPSLDKNPSSGTTIYTAES